MGVTRIVVAVAALAGLGLLPAPAAAQMYRWTDDGGAVHYGHGVDSIPERYRAGARELALPPVPAAPAPVSAVGAPRRAATATAIAGELARIPFTPGRRIMTDVRLNGETTVQLLLDTGADVTVINPRVVVALGLSTRSAIRASIRGVTGSTNALAYRVESMEVQGARVGPMHVVSHDIGTSDGDGLLGRDFLDHFKLTIDNREGVVVLSPK